MPGRDATPSEVLNAYLGALQAGDCQAAHALATSTFVRGNGDLCGVLTLTAYTLAGKPAQPGDGEVIFSTALTTEGGDGSMPDGRHTWFYSLMKQPSGDWRLVGGGSGP